MQKVRPPLRPHLFESSLCVSIGSTHGEETNAWIVAFGHAAAPPSLIPVLRLDQRDVTAMRVEKWAPVKVPLVR